MTQEEKQWIDAATYKQMLQRSRHNAVDDVLFRHGDTSQYFQLMLWYKRQALTREEAMAASKEVGWPCPGANRTNSAL